MQCLINIFQAQPRIGFHNMDLYGLAQVMLPEWRVVGIAKATLALLPLRQTDAHGRAKYRQSFVQANDLQFVQPQQGAFHQFIGVFHFLSQHDVGVEGLEQFAQGCLSQQVDAAAAGRQAVKQVSQ